MAVVPVDFGRQDARLTHRRLILSEILLNGPVSRTEISTRTGLGAASVSRISRELIEAGLIVEGDAIEDNRPGRRFVSLDVNGAGCYVLGISMNIFEQCITLADLKNKAVARRELALTSFSDSDHVIATLIDGVQHLIVESGVPKNKIIGGSLGVAGAVDPEQGTISTAPLFGWQSVPIGQMLSDALDIPFHVESLVNAINLAETRFGIGRGHSDVIVFNASLGIGASMMVENRLIRGANYTVGIIGDLGLWTDGDGARMTVDDAAGGHAVLNELETGAEDASASEAMSLPQKLFQVIERADDGDDVARAALTNAGYRLGEVITAVNGIMHPELILVSGPMAWCPHYIRGIRNAFLDAGYRGNQISLQASDMTWRAATRWLALNEFLINRDIDLDRLSGRTVA